MRSVKSVVVVIGTLLPIGYCGGLLYYFFQVGDPLSGPLATGLGPTVLGLGAIGLLFCVPVVLKLIKVFAAPRSPAPKGRGGAEADEAPAFDADAALARYLARKAAQGEARPELDAAAPRATFGRKTG